MGVVQDDEGYARWPKPVTRCNLLHLHYAARGNRARKNTCLMTLSLFLKTLSTRHIFATIGIIQEAFYPATEQVIHVATNEPATI